MSDVKSSTFLSQVFIGVNRVNGEEVVVKATPLEVGSGVEVEQRKVVGASALLANELSAYFSLETKRSERCERFRVVQPVAMCAARLRLQLPVLETVKWDVYVKSMHVRLLSMIQGVKFLHHCDIGHGDLKPTSWMMNKDCLVLLDLNLSIQNASLVWNDKRGTYHGIFSWRSRMTGML